MTTAHHITDYDLLTDEDPKALAKHVETAIHDGWQPFGSPCVSPRGDGYGAAYAQGIVRDAEHV